jgi:hypothetical protein
MAKKKSSKTKKKLIGLPEALRSRRSFVVSKKDYQRVVKRSNGQQRGRTTEELDMDE